MLSRKKSFPNGNVIWREEEEEEEERRARETRKLETIEREKRERERKSGALWRRVAA